MRNSVVKKSVIGFVSMALVVICCFMPTLFEQRVYAASNYRSWRQFDDEWGDIGLGSSSYTMRKYGCAITSLAMLCVHSGSATGSSFTPGTVANYYNSINGFSYGGINSWADISGLVPKVKFIESLPYEDRITPTKSIVLSDIKSYISKGYYLLCNVGGHFVLIDKVVNDKIYMVDPASADTVLFDRYPNVNEYVSLKVFSGAVPSNSTSSTTTTNVTTTTSKPTTTTTTTTTTTVPKVYKVGIYKTTAALNYRSGASTAYESYGVIPNGTQLTVKQISGNWGKTVYNSKDCWVCLDYTTYVSELPPEYELGEYFVSNTNGSYARTSPNGTANIIAQAGKEYVIDIVEVQNGWGKFYMGMDTAWVQMSELTYAGASKNLINGDINGDGAVDKLDLAVLNQYLETLHTVPDGISLLRQYEIDAADINDDGTVDNNDVLEYLIITCIK